MLSNLPPGVTEGSLPGNRPEDAEIEVTIVFLQYEIDQLIKWSKKQSLLPYLEQHELFATIANIADQLETR